MLKMKLKLSWQSNTALDMCSRVQVYVVSLDIHLDVIIDMGFA
jgi:hypothetical protein